MDNPEKLATQDTRRRQKRQKKKTNTICIGHHYTETNTNNVNKISALPKTTVGKDEPNIVCIRQS